MFALKLKRKLNETASQLQSSEQEQTKLKKLLADKELDNKQKVANSDGPNNNVEETNKSNVTDLESKVKSLTADLEAVKHASARVAELEGIAYINLTTLYSHVYICTLEP